MSLYCVVQGCVELWVGENDDRLVAMQRAKRISMNCWMSSAKLYQLGQRSIDKELLDVVSGYATKWFRAQTKSAALRGDQSLLSVAEGFE